MASSPQPPFDRLSPQVQQLLSRLGIAEPTEAQLAALPHVLRGEHLLLVAPAGMGKTEAVVLPILDRLHARVSLPRVRALPGPTGSSLGPALRPQVGTPGRHAGGMSSWTFGLLLHMTNSAAIAPSRAPSPMPR